MSERLEVEERVVQPTEINDLLADVEEMVKSVDTGFARVTVEPISAGQHQADKALAEAVEETDRCLSCGEPLEEGGFCGLSCLHDSGGNG